MLAEYMPYKACETILKVLMSVGHVMCMGHEVHGEANARELGCLWRGRRHGSICQACAQNLHTLQAAANAKNNQGALKTKLVVAECFADGGPQLKRARPRAQGR